MSDEAQLPPSDDEERGEQPEHYDEEAPGYGFATHEGNEDKIPEAPSTEGRDRRKLAAEVELDPMSLVGSYCHRVENGEIVWAGIVVGEVQPGRYLIELDGCLEGAKSRSVQVIQSIDSLLAKDEGYEWRFYNTELAMKDAYAEHVVDAMTRERS
jgi:hypothetical protein